MRWCKIIIIKKIIPENHTNKNNHGHSQFTLSPSHSWSVHRALNRAIFLSFIFEMLPYHTSGLQSLCRIGPMNIYSWSCKIVIWFNCAAEVPTSSSGHCLRVSWQKEPKASPAPRGDGARSRHPSHWGTEGDFRLSSCSRVFYPKPQPTPFLRLHEL